MLERRIKAASAVAALLVAVGAHAQAGAPSASAPPPAVHPARHVAPPHKPRLDTSGRTRIGKASFYAGKFSGRRMADGTRMDPRDDSAASKTLPLGTTAKVTNLETGESAVVTIRDRGPHVPGRIVDLTPATAAKVGIDRQEGVSKVAVTPVSVPPVDQRPQASDKTPDAHATGPRPQANPVQR